MKKFKVAVVGATGAVGREMMRMLEVRDFPVGEIIPLASLRSEGTKVVFRGKEVAVKNLENFAAALPSGAPALALFSAGGDISKQYAPKFAAAGCFVVDNSSAFRMDARVPLVVPEVNPDDLAADKKIIANPNCSTIQMVVALNPLHLAAKIRRVIVATYQSVSGAGGRAIEELLAQTKALAEGKPVPPPSKFAYQIALNLIPQIDVFLDNGYTKEEMKMVNETKKIMRDESIELSATCVRVPVIRSHSEAVWVEFEKDISPEAARDILRKSPGVEVVDDPAAKKYPMPLDAENKQVTYVGRIRRDISSSAKKSLTFWIVSDNLLKGAALNAVEIAETLLKKKFLV
ncbi:MAG: aspartate-semialdehyde dehydrogenase [Endomicrobiia bacterium]|nr:aspartate-semialdehyde dehydrogenase [Endomicrobiia bacterium]